MDSKMHEVCSQLDDLSLQILVTIERQVKCKVRLEDILKMGYLNIAKSRYIMGNNSVSSLQLPTECSSETSALHTITTSMDESETEHMTFKLHNMSLLVKEEKDDANETNSVRKRTDKTEEDIMGKNGIVQPNSTKNGIYFNPIKWFGVLVPQNLRQAQNNFQLALELVVESVNIQSELEALRQKYVKLSHAKLTLVS